MKVLCCLAAITLVTGQCLVHAVSRLLSIAQHWLMFIRSKTESSDVVISVKQVTTKYFREEGKYLWWSGSDCPPWNDEMIQNCTDWPRQTSGLCRNWRGYSTSYVLEESDDVLKQTGAGVSWVSAWLTQDPGHRVCTLFSRIGGGRKIMFSTELFLFWCYSRLELLYHRHKMWKYRILDIET